MKAINLHSQSFEVRPEVAELIGKLPKPKNIQELLCSLFGALNGDGVYTDEYALTIAVYFPDSKAIDLDKRQGRCAADVRKYNHVEFKCQLDSDGVPPAGPPAQVKHLDGGKRSSQLDELAVAEGLEQLKSQLS